MPQYILKHGNTTKPLGDFPSLAEVRKLAIFKLRPMLTDFIVEVTPQVQQRKRYPRYSEKPSNRWAFVYDSPYMETHYLRGTYTPAELRNNFPELTSRLRSRKRYGKVPFKAIKILKTGYHPEADKSSDNSIV